MNLVWNDLRQWTSVLYFLMTSEAILVNVQSDLTWRGQRCSTSLNPRVATTSVSKVIGVGARQVIFWEGRTVALGISLFSPKVFSKSLSSAAAGVKTSFSRGRARQGVVHDPLGQMFRAMPFKEHINPDTHSLMPPVVCLTESVWKDQYIYIWTGCFF